MLLSKAIDDGLSFVIWYINPVFNNKKKKRKIDKILIALFSFLRKLIWRILKNVVKMKIPPMTRNGARSISVRWYSRSVLSSYAKNGIAIPAAAIENEIYDKYT